MEEKAMNESVQIEIRDLTKIYKLNKKQMQESHTKNPKKTAVDHLTLTARAGEIYGLLGPNGAGKTTTLRCIATIIKPTSGEIFVNGNEVQKHSEAVRKSSLHILESVISPTKRSRSFPPV